VGTRSLSDGPGQSAVALGTITGPASTRPWDYNGGCDRGLRWGSMLPWAQV